MSLGSMPVSQDAVLRVSVFLFVLLVMLIVERIKPARTISSLTSVRWRSNIFVFATGILVVKLMGPVVAVSAALWAQKNDFGLLHIIDLDATVSLVLALFLLDAAIYLQHYLSHRIRFFWQFHRVHHADPSIDAGTALRFHPVEIAVSMLYKCAVVLLLGASWWAVLLFEIILNASAIFNHANIRLPKKLDSVLRLVLVTPRMHLVHHSVAPIEHHSNFGFCLSLWDRLFATYRSDFQSQDERLGLEAVKSEQAASWKWLIFSPFQSGSGK